jgi:dTDP-4-dehydrorhamnose 3,5-epimerase
MDVRATRLPGVRTIDVAVHRDERGFLIESYRAERYAAAGLNATFVQDNASRSTRGVLRGLHFQHPPAQAKLVFVPMGTVFDVAVDLRASSPTFGRWHGELLSADNHRQLFIPPGFAHGFCVLSDEALVCYKCSAPYREAAARAVKWNDPDIGIEWPVAQPFLSATDAAAPALAGLDRAWLMPYDGRAEEV